MRIWRKNNQEKGASNHGMVIRKGHYRIFKDAKQKVRQMSRWNDPDENIPNIFLDKYKKEIILDKNIINEVKWVLFFEENYDENEIYLIKDFKEEKVNMV